MTAILPAVLIILPLHLKHNVFKDVIYSVAESDILEIRDGIYFFLASFFEYFHIFELF